MRRIRAGVEVQHPRARFSRPETLRTVRAVLQGERRPATAITVVYTDSRYIRRINRRHHHHDTVTDVLAFDLGERRGREGEVYVNLDRARRQARVYGVSMVDEVRRLVIHGILHILGYRDHSRAGKATMTRKEDRYILKLQRR